MMQQARNIVRGVPRRRLSDKALRVSDCVVRALRDEGVSTVFGIPGGPIAPLNDAFLRLGGVETVITRHENTAVFAAAGHAQTTGRLGVALVTAGPGVLNAMTGLASAHCDGLPVLLLVGEVSRNLHGRGALQDGSAHHLGILNMVRSISKLALEVTSAEGMVAALKRAMNTALSGRRGPVVVTLPMDILASTATTPVVATDVDTQFSINPGALERVEQEIAHSRRGVIFVGSGVRFGAGPERLYEFAERLQWPVMTTPKAKGVFPEGHPLSLGVFGMGGHLSTQEYLEQGVETVLAIGTSLGDLSTNGWSELLRPSRALIHVDIDVGQTGRNYAATMTLGAPAQLFLGQMIWRLSPNRSGRRFEIKRHVDPEQDLLGTEGTIAPHRALWEIQQVMPGNTIYTVDSGEHYFFATHYLRATRPDGYIAMTGLGSMGSSIGAAIGAQLAHPKRPVAVVCGDGGFGMVGSEVSVAAHYGAPVRVFVFNDQRLGMVELGHEALYGRSPTFSTAPMDVGAMGAALGAQSLVVEQPGEILAARGLLREHSGPVVVDVHIDRSVKMPKNKRFETLKESA